MHPELSSVHLEDSNSFDVEGRLLVDQMSKDGDEHFTSIPGPSRIGPSRGGPGEGSRILYSPAPCVRSDRPENSSTEYILNSRNGVSHEVSASTREFNFNSESRVENLGAETLNSRSGNKTLQVDTRILQVGIICIVWILGSYI